MLKAMFKRKENQKNVGMLNMAETFPPRKVLNKELRKNPWQTAQRMFDAQHGELLTRAYNWRKIALITSLTAFLAVFGLILISMQKKYVPYVVEVDKLGNAVTARFLSPNNPSDIRVTKAYVGRFINNWRSVTFDTGLERTFITDLYSMLAAGTPAVTKISEYFKKASPLDRAKKGTVVVDITSVLQMSDHIWEVQWTETANTLQGNVAGVSRWIATLNLASNPPQEEEQILKNPLGIFIKDLNWSQQL